MKRNTYSREDIIKAVHEYQNGYTSVEVATKYGIPSSTIRNHKYNHKSRFGGGRPKLLTHSQEEYPVKLLQNFEHIGVRLTKPKVMKLSSEYVQSVTGSK